MQTLYYYSNLDSPIGPLIIGVSDRGLTLLEFDRGNFPPKSNQVLWTESRQAT